MADWSRRVAELQNELARANLRIAELEGRPPEAGAPSREAIARIIDPFPWDRRDLGMVGRGDEVSIDRSLKIADAILALMGRA